jgi:hypothetical protein
MDPLLAERLRANPFDIGVVNAELAKILERIYQQYGEEGFEWLIQQYHNGDSAPLSNLLHELQQSMGIDVRRKE